MIKRIVLLSIGILCVQGAFAQKKSTFSTPVEFSKNTKKAKKEVVYQVFTRLFGNTNTANKPWGTIEENGVGKFNDFTDKALQEIKDLGVTHIWYTGVPHHALIGDYTKYGISNDDPDVVKGRAGSPYAVKDYYNVNPDLAIDPNQRLEEFEALIQRSHKAGLQVIIDIVPNHVARNYEGKTNPKGVVDFGFNDKISLEYTRDNNFYYIPKSKFLVPFDANYKPLGGEKHPLSDNKFDEVPAKWTGNGSRLIQPSIHDWYETVKINYGVSPDGKQDFPSLPQNFEHKDFEHHFKFWSDKDIPDSWKKFKSIALYWLGKGVDGFRYDMAEMVPVEFWSYLNSNIKMKNSEAFLLAEVYNPKEYRNYIYKGKMDYLYDKVELYDTLKSIVHGKASTKDIATVQNRMIDIEHHMLHFLENHDEQRLASPEFASNPENGKPLMVVSTTISSSPTMIYFGQEVGEPGALDSGFGRKSRTTIFDYAGVPHHQRWMNKGLFDGGKLTEQEKALREFYKRLLNFSIQSEALMGDYLDLQESNLNNVNYDKHLYSFARWKGSEKLVIIANFNKEEKVTSTLKLPDVLIKPWKLKDGSYMLIDQLYEKQTAVLVIKDGVGWIEFTVPNNESFIFKIQ
jgi:glycosidase